MSYGKHRLLSVVHHEKGRLTSCCLPSTFFPFKTPLKALKNQDNISNKLLLPWTS